MSKTNSVSLLENILLSVIYFEFKNLQCDDLLHPASCTDRAMLFQILHEPTWPRNSFFWTLMAHHTL